MSANTLHSKPVQRQLLAPKLITQLKVAELSLTELLEYARSEIDNNPLLRNDTNDFDKRIEEALASQNTSFWKPSFSAHPSQVVLADAEIRIRKSAIDVLLNDRGIPKLHINPLYRKILKNPNAPTKTKEFVREQLKKALTLIDAIKKRRASLHKLIQIIVKTQKDFLTRKSRQMKPLTLSDLAAKLNLHISTVSRIARQKHVLINGETIPLRNLFSSPFKNNPSLPIKSVLSRLKEMLRDTSDHTPLSDQEISILLKKEGVSIARRTVAKYRQVLGISSSFGRKNL